MGYGLKGQNEKQELITKSSNISSAKEIELSPSGKPLRLRGGKDQIYV